MIYQTFGGVTQDLERQLSKLGWVCETERWGSSLTVHLRGCPPRDGNRVLVVQEAHTVYSPHLGRKPSTEIIIFCNEPPAWRVNQGILTPFGHSPKDTHVPSFLKLEHPTIVEDLVHLIRTCGLAWLSGGNGRGGSCKTCPLQLECLTKEA